MHISSKDVVHGLSIQPVNMNFQVYPTYDYVLEFKPTEAGEYRIICNEFCGIGHHTMIGRIGVIEQESDLKKHGFNKLRKPPLKTKTGSSAPLSEADKIMLGEQVFTLKGCGACHKTDGTVLIGPSWKGLFGRKEQVKENGKIKTVVVDEAYLKESILEPSKLITVGFENTPMPQVPMTDEELDHLIAYIKSLKN